MDKRKSHFSAKYTKRCKSEIELYIAYLSQPTGYNEEYIDRCEPKTRWLYNNDLYQTKAKAGKQYLKDLEMDPSLRPYYKECLYAKIDDYTGMTLDGLVFNLKTGRGKPRAPRYNINGEEFYALQMFYRLFVWAPGMTNRAFNEFSTRCFFLPDLVREMNTGKVIDKIEDLKTFITKDSPDADESWTGPLQDVLWDGLEEQGYKSSEIQTLIKKAKEQNKTILDLLGEYGIQ